MSHRAVIATILQDTRISMKNYGCCTYRLSMDWTNNNGEPVLISAVHVGIGQPEEREISMCSVLNERALHKTHITKQWKINDLCAQSYYVIYDSFHCSGHCRKYIIDWSQGVLKRISRVGSSPFIQIAREASQLSLTFQSIKSRLVRNLFKGQLVLSVPICGQTGLFMKEWTRLEVNSLYGVLVALLLVFWRILKRLTTMVAFTVDTADEQNWLMLARISNFMCLRRILLNIPE